MNDQLICMGPAKYPFGAFRIHQACKKKWSGFLLLICSTSEPAREGPYRHEDAQQWLEGGTAAAIVVPSEDHADKYICWVLSLSWVGDVVCCEAVSGHLVRVRSPSEVRVAACVASRAVDTTAYITSVPYVTSVRDVRTHQVAELRLQADS